MLKNGVIYFGASAGTHIATCNIEHVKYFDNNESLIKNYKGLNLYTGVIICHYNDSRKAIYNKLKEKGKYKVETLTNNEMLFLNKNEWIKYSYNSKN